MYASTLAGDYPTTTDGPFTNRPSAIDPALMHDDNDIAARQAWKSLRFVRAGHFTVDEGIAYVQYFYEEMAPLTPVKLPNFHDLKTHAKLLTDEPMLTVTILAIASRYMELKTIGGRSRMYVIHDKLWEYLQSMITRMFWGQEQFGGGFCGAGGLSKSVEETEARRRGLRTIGTAERSATLREFEILDWLGLLTSRIVCFCSAIGFPVACISTLSTTAASFSLADPMSLLALTRTWAQIQLRQ